MITREAAAGALNMLEIDELGLDQHRPHAMLSTMIKKFGGGPVGLDTLAAVHRARTRARSRTYTSRTLMQLGFVMRTPRGRILTPAAYEHMKLPMPQEDSDDRQLRFDFDDEE